MVDDSNDIYKVKFDSSLHQKTLFPIEDIAAFETETAVSADEMKRWHDKEWLSFNPSALDEFDEQQRIEVEFVKGLVRSGLSDEWIGKLLSKLEKPYCYDPKDTFYSFADQSWKTMPRIPEPEEVVEESLDSYLEGLADAEERERLLEIRETIDDLLEKHAEGTD
ncbi:unnamed protein product [marine sediment metagenome]|uniref:Uncharacterized protein n=1 Tax=marine sediment metagenome TaxID=412755 RepID=X1MUK9_9ZZZZ